MCVCVCVCERERERERLFKMRGRERMHEKQSEKYAGGERVRKTEKRERKTY